MILCEGTSDQSFFKHLIKARGLPPFDVVTPREKEDAGGVAGYASRLRALRLERGFDSVRGLIVTGDNDDDPGVGFQTIRSHLQDASGYSLPHEPLVTYPARFPDSPAVAILMIPWSGEVGALETLCLQSMTARHPALARCVEEFCECSGTSQWPRNKVEKMRVRAMLTASCKTDPNTSLVHAWSRKGYDLIPLEHPCFDRIADFLRDFAEKTS